MDRNPSLTDAQAVTEACKRNPSLDDAYIEESGANRWQHDPSGAA